MRKFVLFCLVFSCLFLIGCGSIGNAITSTKNVCCCRITSPPKEGMPYHTYQHFSMCIPPDYEVATNMDAPPTVNKDPEMCEQFCSTMAALAR